MFPCPCLLFCKTWSQITCEIASYYWNFEYHWENKTVMNIGATRHELSSTSAWKTFLCAWSAVIPDPHSKEVQNRLSSLSSWNRPHLFQQGLCNPFYMYRPKIETIRCTIPQILLNILPAVTPYLVAALAFHPVSEAGEYQSTTSSTPEEIQRVLRVFWRRANILSVHLFFSLTSEKPFFQRCKC